MPLVLAQLLPHMTATSLNERGTHGWAPLHMLAQNKNNENDKCEMIRLLLDARADPDVRGRRGATPLFKAAGTAATSQARVLLQYGADVNLASEDGTTPLDATWANRECRDVIIEYHGKSSSNLMAKSLHTSPTNPMHSGSPCRPPTSQRLPTA